MVKTSGMIARAIAVILVFVTLLTDPAFAAVANTADKTGKTDPKYVSEVKLFYGTTEDYARKQCEAEGYTFCPENLQQRDKELLLKVYLGYKETGDEEEAITDMTLLDGKNSHFYEMDLAKYARENENELTDIAETVMQLVYNFRMQYKQGNPNAIAAYDSLNVISLEENSRDDLLGDYILDKADTAFFHELLLKGNSLIISSVISYLSGAAAENGRSGWVERSKTSSVREECGHDSGELNEYDAKYMGDAQVLAEQIENLIETYDTAMELYEEHGETFGYEIPDMRDCQAVVDAAASIPGCRIPEYLGVIGTYSLLDSIEYESASEVIKSDADLLYADDTETEDKETEEPEEETYGKGRSVAELFRDIAAADDKEFHFRDVYALLAGMSSVQKTVWKLGGLTMFTQTLLSLDDYEKERASILKERRHQLAESGIRNSSIWLWQGSTTELYESKIVQTNASIEKSLSGEAVQESINKTKRNEFDKTAYYLGIANIAWDCLSLIDTLISLFGGAGLSGTLISWGISVLASVETATGCLACLGYAFGYFLSFLGYAFTVAVYAGLLYSVFQLFCYLSRMEYGEPIQFDEVDYSQIPDTVVHVIEDGNVNYRIWYDTVKSNLTREYLDELNGEAVKKQIEDPGNYTMPVTYPVGGYTPVHQSDRVTVPLDLTLGFDNWERNVDPTKHGDITGYQGLRDRWVNLYTTKSPAAGAPIQVGTVDQGLPGFFITTGDASKEYEGCRPLKLIGAGLAEDIQSASAQHSFKTEAPGTPTYLHFVTDPDRIYSEVSKKKEDTGDDSGLFVHDVRLCHADKMEDAKNRLKKASFDHIIDMNLTPGDGYTYVGYQMGSREKAVRDIRVSTQSGALSLNFGDGVYTRAGMDDSVGIGSTKDGVSLYYSISPCTGTPIKKISVETERQKIGSGAEPVCLFSGGDAVNLKPKFSDGVRTSDSDGRKFKTSQPDISSEPRYLYFWPEEEYKAPEGDPDDGSKAPYIAGLSYFMGLDHDGEDRRFGTYDEYIQKFADDYGFELIRNEDGAPAKMMPDNAAEMNPYLQFDRREGIQFLHFFTHCEDRNFTHGICYMYAYSRNIVPFDVDKAQATLYLGVSYTYNPYRAITGVAGLIAPYTETTHSIRNGMATPAGTLQPSTVCINGNPVAQAGISLGYFNYNNMETGVYTNYKTHTKSNLPWMSDVSTEIHSRYLLLDGPVKGREPYRRDDLVFVTRPDPGSIDGYVPVGDMRVPGDYEHPMNFALETENKGSEYLYIYMSRNAGKRAKDGAGDQNVYKKKKYIAAVVCGSGKTEEEAISNLYRNAAKEWPNLSAGFRDIPDAPLLSELDGLIPVDPAKDKPWHAYKIQDVSSINPGNGDVYRSNEAAFARWDSFGEYRRLDRFVDEYEVTGDYAYIGVIRTDQGTGGKNIVVEKRNENGNPVDKKGREIIDGKVVDSEGNVIEGEEAIPDTEKMRAVNPVHGMIKYYVKDDTEPLYKLQMGGDTVCIKAGGPFRSAEGTYYLYYSTNIGTASYSAPATELEFSNEPFAPGCNCCFSCSERDMVESAIPDDAAGQNGEKKRYSLPAYSSLRMRPDEKTYIHLRYDEADLPYVERVYLGVGDTREECVLDLLSTTGSQCVSGVNCNYNSFSKKWVAIGYRRTADAKTATKDVLLYSGEDAPNELYTTAYKKAGSGSEEVTVRYVRIDHHLKAGGAEKISLNAGCTNGAGLYLYYTEAARTGTLYYDRECKRPYAPIRNFAYGYGGNSPADVNEAQYYTNLYGGLQSADTEDFTDMKWECVMGVEADAVDNGVIDSASTYPMELNHGQLPGVASPDIHGGDMRIMMYADHGGGTEENDYKIRSRAVPKPGGSTDPGRKVTGHLTQNE